MKLFKTICRTYQEVVVNAIGQGISVNLINCIRDAEHNLILHPEIKEYTVGCCAETLYGVSL